MSELKLVVIGSTGSGKSSLCNVLAGLDCMGSDSGGFPVSEKLSAGTYKTTCQRVKWLGNGEKMMIIDTPGLDDPEGNDTEHIADMVDKLKEVRYVNLFLIIFNAQRPRMDSSLKSMFKIFQGIFGSGFWSNTAILFSRWAFDSRSEKQRQREGMTTANHEEMVNEYFRSSFNPNRRIPCVFIDSCHMSDDPREAAAFTRETQRLHDILMKMQEYECKDFEKVLSERDDLMQKTDIAIKEKETAENEAKIANHEKQKALKEKKVAEERERIANEKSEKLNAELSEVRRNYKEKLQKANQKIEQVKNEAEEKQSRLKEAKENSERLREETERKAAADKLIMQQEFKSAEEKLAMEKKINKENEIKQAQLHEAEKRERDAKYQAQLAEEQTRLAEREKETTRKEAEKHEEQIQQKILEQKNQKEEAEKREKQLQEENERRSNEMKASLEQQFAASERRREEDQKRIQQQISEMQKSAVQNQQKETGRGEKIGAALGAIVDAANPVTIFADTIKSFKK